MSAPDPGAILSDSPLAIEARRLGAELGAKFAVADKKFFRKVARFAPLAPVLGGEVGKPEITTEALVGLGEGCANGGLLLGLGAHAFAVASSIRTFAAPEIAKALLPRLQSGAKIGAFAATEPGAGSDVMALATSITETKSGYVLNGEKTYITNATEADVFLVFATRDRRLHSRGVSCFLIEKSAPGLTVEEIPVEGMTGCGLGKLTLNDVRVPKGKLIGRLNAGIQIFRHGMVQERILLSAFLVGSMKRALALSTAHAKTRQQFGAPIAAKQFVSGRIVDIARRYATSKLLLDYAVARLAKGKASDTDASLTKLQASEAAVACQLDLFRTGGGRSLETEGGNCAALLDALSSLTYSGTSDLQKIIVAAALDLPS